MVAGSAGGHRSSGDIGKSGGGRGGGNANNNNSNSKDGGDRQDEDSSAMEEEEKSLIIPITSSKKTNNLFIEMFPEEVAEVGVGGMSAVLKEEKAGMSVWCDAALLYLKENGDENAAELLNSACDLEDSLAGSRSDRVRLLASAGIALLNRATSFKANQNPGDRKALMEKDTAKASDRFTRAGIIDPMSPQAWVGNGMLNLTCDNTKQARFYFETTLKHCGPILPALLGLAAVRYQERDYRGAQELYGRAIRYYPQVNSSRIGFGMACYQLGQVDRARAAFSRAHAVDPENVEAMLGCAILDMAAVGGGADVYHQTTPQHRQRLENAIKLISIANLVDGSNAMVQNHLANHYFWKWNPVMAGASPVTVRIAKGSQVLELIQPESESAAPITAQSLGLEVGERIRIGDLLETLLVGDDDEEDDDDEENRKTLRIRDKWPFDNDGEDNNGDASAHKLWKKDYERVITLAKSAHDSTAVDEIQAESLLILARVHHSRDDMPNAAKYYDQACKKAPSLSPARFGLAQTAIWDEKFEDASAHLRLILGTLPHATDVLALLGLLGCKESITSSSSSTNKQNTSSSSTKAKGAGPATATNSRTEALAHLKKASDQEPLNAELVLLEALALQQQESDFSAALERYRRALQLMEGRQVSWEVYTNMGVLCHETKRYQDALGYYESALRALDEDEPPQQQQQQTQDLIRHEANQLFWNYVDTEVTLGVPSTDSGGSKILPVLDGEADALEKLQVADAIRLGEHDNKDSEAQWERKRTAFESEITGFIKDEGGRVKAVKLKRKYRPPPPRSDTDMEVEGETEKATPPTSLRMYVKRSNDRLLNPSAISVAFNLARLHEAAGRIVAAVELHKAIVKRHPSYVNSYLRLACIARDCGSLKDCSEWLKSAAAVAPGNPEVLTLVGNLHLSLCDWAPAQSVFDQLYMQKVPNVEAYSLLCLGTIYFNNLKTPNKYTKHLTYAADFYKKILTSDKANAYAANGIGTIMAERGELVKAKEVFSRVREVSGDGIADSLLNLGHIFLAQKRHPEALQLYQSYMNRTRGTAGAPITSRSHEEDDAEVLLYIAFAYYDWARQTELLNDARSAPADERYTKCMECIEEAMKKSKRENVVLRYNLCIAKLRAANCVLLKPDRNVRRTAAEVQRALDGLQESLPVVRTLIQWKNEKKKVPIAMSMMNDYVTHCTRNIESAKKHLEDENEKEAKSREKREIQRLHALTEQKEREMEEALRRERDAIAREEREKRAKMKMAKVSSLVAGWEEEAAAHKIAKEKSAENAKKRKGPSVAPASAPPGGVDVEEGIFDNEVPQDSALFDDTDDDDDDDDNNNNNDKNKAEGPLKKKAEAKPPPPPPPPDNDDDDEEEAAFGNDNGNEDGGAGGGEGGGGTENKAPAEEDLFGASSEEESDEELVGTSGKKRGAGDAGGEGAAKKQRTLDNDDEEDEL